MGRSRFAPPAIAAPPAAGNTIESRRRSGNYQRFDVAARAFNSPSAPAAPQPSPEERDLMARREQARRDGYAQGLEEGRALAQSHVAEYLEHLGKTLQDLASLRAVVTESYRREMVELALASAEALVQHELIDQAATLQHLIDAGLEALGRSEPLRLHLHPDDRPRVDDAIHRAAAAGYDLTVVEDHTLHPGDLRVDNELGTVESVLHDRLARIRQLVIGELEAGRASSTGSGGS